MNARRTLPILVAVAAAAATAWWLLGSKAVPDAPAPVLEAAPKARARPASATVDAPEAATDERVASPREEERRAARESFVLRVLDAETDEPIAGATLLFERRALGKVLVLGSFESDARGEFHVLLRGRERSARVTAPGYVPRSYRDWADGQRTIRLARGARLVVELRDGHGREATGYRVYATPLVSPRSRRAERYADAAARGRVEFDDLPDCRCRIAVYPIPKENPFGTPFRAPSPRGVLALHTEVVDVARSAPKSVVIRLLARIDFTLHVRSEGRAVTDGRVGVLTLRKAWNNQETPIDERLERALGASGGAQYGATRSLDKEGKVRFKALQVAVRDFEVRVGHHRFPHRKRIDLRRYGNLREASATIELRPGRLRIELEGSAEELELASVYVRETSMRLATRVGVLGKRTLDIEGLGEGEYEVVLRGRGILEMPGRTVRVEEGATQTVRLRVPPRVQVTVRVPGAERSAVVRWRLQGQSDVQRASLVGGQGVIELAPGTWILDARTQRGEDSYGPARTVTIREGFPRTIDLNAR